MLGWNRQYLPILVQRPVGNAGLVVPNKLVHLACFAIRSVPYFEYVESEANWADEISRKGTQGNWAPDNAFSVDKCGIAAELLALPSLAVIRIFEYL